MPAFGQRVDEMRDGGAGADADHHAVFDVTQRGTTGDALFLILAHGGNLREG
jgi:hypothetical protein